MKQTKMRSNNFSQQMLIKNCNQFYCTPGTARSPSIIYEFILFNSYNIYSCISHIVCIIYKDRERASASKIHMFALFVIITTHYLLKFYS
jgi:hypothetical protein